MSKYVNTSTIIKCINSIYRIVPNYITTAPAVKEYLLSDKCIELNELFAISEILTNETAAVVFSKMTTFGQLLGCHMHCTNDVQLSLLEDELIKRIHIVMLIYHYHLNAYMQLFTIHINTSGSY